MCGRFTLRTNPQQLSLHFACEVPPDLPPRYNLAPTQLLAAVRSTVEQDGRRFAPLRWGLIPSWAKQAAIGNRLINARAESVAEKPAFRAAFRRRRCLILADGYYEWKKHGKAKQPYFIRRADERPFAFAGLWEVWRDPQREETVQSCTIITTDADSQTRSIHDRMPVILPDQSYGIWLDPAQQDPGPLLPLLRTGDTSTLIADPVDPWMNNPRHDAPRCVVPAVAEARP